MQSSEIGAESQYALKPLNPGQTQEAHLLPTFNRQASSLKSFDSGILDSPQKLLNKQEQDLASAATKVINQANPQQAVLDEESSIFSSFIRQYRKIFGPSETEPGVESIPDHTPNKDTPSFNAVNKDIANPNKNFINKNIPVHPHDLDPLDPYQARLYEISQIKNPIKRFILLTRLRIRQIIEFLNLFSPPHRVTIPPKTPTPVPVSVHPNPVPAESSSWWPSFWPSTSPSAGNTITDLVKLQEREATLELEKMVLAKITNQITKKLDKWWIPSWMRPSDKTIESVEKSVLGAFCKARASSNPRVAAWAVRKQEEIAASVKEYKPFMVHLAINSLCNAQIPL